MKYALAAVAITAQPSLSDTIDYAEYAQTALRAGNDRLAIYAASSPQLPLRTQVAAGLLSNSRGFEPGTGSGYLGSQVNFSPVLAYDNNINGGSEKSGFSWGGFWFSHDPEDVARRGWVGGANANIGSRFALGDQTRLTLGGSARAVYSPDYDLSKFRSATNGCLEHQVQRDVYTNACLGYSRYNADISRSQTTRASVGADKLFDAFGGIHDFSISLSRTYTWDMKQETGYGQPRLSVDMVSIFSTSAVWGYGISFAKKVDGERTPVFTTDISRSQKIIGHDVTIDVSYATIKGGNFLGQSFSEDQFIITADIQINDRITINTYYSKNFSQQNYFESNQIGFVFQMRFI